MVEIPVVLFNFLVLLCFAITKVLQLLYFCIPGSMPALNFITLPFVTEILQKQKEDMFMRDLSELYQEDLVGAPMSLLRDFANGRPNNISIVMFIVL